MRQDILAQLEQCQNLPTIPAVVMQILQVCQKSDFSIDELAKVIRNDPALSVKLLKIVNSPMFGIAREISSVSEALIWLGVNAVRTISLSLSIATNLRAGKSFDYKSYWKRSLLSALVASQIAESKNCMNKEEVFLAALLQDIGILVMNTGLGQSYRDIFASANGDHMKLIDLERQTLDTDHAQVGAWLARRWNLPQSIISTIRNSHGSLGNITQQEESHIWVRLSGWIADIWLESDTASVTQRARVLTHEFLGMENSQFETLLTNITELIPETSKLFEVDLGNEIELRTTLAQAQETLMLLSLQSMLTLESRNREIEERSQRDDLTGLFNRRRMESFLTSAFLSSRSKQAPLSIIFCDIDHFKSVNDTYGHQTGDQVLVRVAKLIMNETGETDLAARYGGEEFVIILPNTTEEEAGHFAEDIRKNLKSQRIETESKQDIQVTISLGYVTYKGERRFNNTKELLAAADRALYAAKSGGRDQVVCFNSLCNYQHMRIQHKMPHN